MSLDLALTIGGIAYGSALIWTMFARNRLTEVLRIDTLFMPKAGEKTRVLNLGFGALVLGYNLYTLYKNYLLK